MYFIPIAFIILCIYVLKGFSTGVQHVRASNAAANVNAQQASFKALAVADYDEEQELRKTFNGLSHDIFEFLGRAPTEEEEDAIGELWVKRNVSGYLHLLCKTAPLGKLPSSSIHGHDYTTHNKAARRVIEEVYLKAERCLREHGTPTAVCIERIPPDNGATQTYALGDLVRYGSPCTGYGDKFCWANYSFYQPIRNMIR